MPSLRKPGMDHEYYEFSPIATRRRLRWPGGARLALCVIVDLEYFELKPPETAFTLDRQYLTPRVRPFPDITRASHREYGNRVGIFGIMKLLDRYGIRATAAMDATVAAQYPFLVKECQKRDWEIIGHGVTGNRLITSLMSEEEERNHIAAAVQAINDATGQKPLGWLGLEYSESARTPHLLAEQGIRYVCDWGNDEQPYPMNVKTGTMYSLPVTADLDDHTALGLRHTTIMDYAKRAKEAFDALYREGSHSGRMLVLHLHPWMIGQPFRLKYLDQILAHFSKRKKVWKGTGRDIIDWYSQNYAP